jgi:hypothetical protein
MYVCKMTLSKHFFANCLSVLIIIFTMYYAHFSVFITVKLVTLFEKNKHRILCIRSVSGITFIRYAQSRKAGKPNNFKSFGTK